MFMNLKTQYTCPQFRFLGDNQEIPSLLWVLVRQVLPHS